MKSNKDKYKVLQNRKEKTDAQAYNGDNWLGSDTVEKLGVTVNHKLSMNQQCHAVFKIANAIWDCINKTTVHKPQEATVLLA